MLLVKFYSSIGPLTLKPYIIGYVEYPSGEGDVRSEKLGPVVCETV